MEYTLNLKTRPFDAILARKKKIEIRACKNKYKKLKCNDRLLIMDMDTHRKMLCTILRITHYSSVLELLKAEGTEVTLSSTKNIEEGIKSIESIADYKERIKKNGVFAIELVDPTLQIN